MKKIISFCNLVKIEHTIFALPFLILTLVVLQCYNSYINIQKILWVFVAFASARVIGMALNRIIDYYIDSKNPRTMGRPLQKKELTIQQTWIFLITFLLLYLYSAFTINMLVFKLSPLLLLYMAFYPYTKRFTYLCHFILGSIHAMLPIAISVALYGKVYMNLLFLSLGIMFLISGSDIIYALLDVEFDRREKIYSIPAKFGQSNSILVAVGTYVVSLISFTLFFMSINSHLQMYSYLAIILSFIILVMVFLKLNKNKILFAEKAFFMNNVVVSILLTLGTLVDYYVSK